MRRRHLKRGEAKQRSPSSTYQQLLSNSKCFTITISIIYCFTIIPHHVQAISIKPADFDRLIMPCYLGGSASSMSGSYSGGLSQPLSPGQNPVPPGGYAGSNGLNGGYQSNGGQLSRANLNNANGQQNLGSNGMSSGFGQPAYYGSDAGRVGSPQSRDGFSNLGQTVPRANTIDNFIALVSKIEAANPRLANNPDQLIKTLLGRFHLDNYYYDVRSRTPIGDADARSTEIIPALLNSMGNSQQLQPHYILSSDAFPEHLLDHDEKCSMYFMLSHFIDKATPVGSPMSVAGVNQLIGPLGGQRPPSLQAAGSGYPAQSANNAYTGGASGPRYPGPSPSFGSPATANMNSFGSGVNTNPADLAGGRNPYGMNVPQPNPIPYQQNYNNMRNSAQFSGSLGGNSRYQTPFIDGNGRSRDERQAQEYGVVTVANQENAAIVLGRVLMGILAASTPPQTIRMLAAAIYPNQPLQTNSPKIDEEIDPLYAVTLADLWAVSSIPKPGKPSDIRLLGDNGRWNDTMCPTSFTLDRAQSIRFTTAELLGGLDGFSLGMFRRRMMGMRKSMRLSEMLRMYYSRTGFRPQFAEVGVCNRGTAINTQLDDLHRQAENYLRLYQLNLPISDNDIAISLNRVNSFKEVARQASSAYSPPEICQDSSYNDAYPTGPQDQCEIAKVDVVTVLDSSQQANQPFMNMVAAKLAQKLGLSREGNTFSVLTNQQDSTGYAGAYSFNALVRNSTNTAEVGCALVHDTTRSYQGGQITDPNRLVEMFERALVNLDSEYLTRQTASGSSSSYRSTSSYVSSIYQSDSNMYMNGPAPKSTGGAKVIIYFNYGPQQRPSQIASGPTNWMGQNSDNSQNQYKFHESKKYLRENFRGASILAVSTNREDVKAFVFDEDRDIFTDIPQGSEGSLTASDTYPSVDPTSYASLAGPADNLVNKLTQRMCDIPAMFQYPLCFRVPSENTAATGFISPGRKQHWMMSPKTFFASQSVRMAFKVEGGRLRVCFGRKPKPDETAARNGQQTQYQPNPISLNNGPPQNNQPVSTSTSSSSDYYTGMESGVCKDISPGQETDFIVSDPCYKKSIADCEPFYYVIKEISNPGEGDPNYMCRDEGCKRFDQAKFVMTHTGVTCNSAFKAVKANWLLILISLAATLCFSGEMNSLGRMLLVPSKSLLVIISTICLSLSMVSIQQVQAQQAGVYDFGQGRYGQKRGNFTPSEILAIVLLVMTIIAGLALTIALCYYVTKRSPRGMEPVSQEES